MKSLSQVIRSKRALAINAFLFTIVFAVQALAPVRAFAAESKPFAADSRVIEVNGYNIHHLSDDGICGTTQFINDYIDYEGFAGLKVHCDGTTVSYTMYSHADTFKSGDVSIQRNRDESTRISLGSIKVDETKSFDIRTIADSKGLYTLTLMSGKDGKEPATIWLYYDGNKVQTCRYNMQNQSDLEAWNKLIGKLDPKTCLGMYVGSPSNPITYPTSGTNGNCNHVDEWCAKADEIIKNDDWSDELKTFALVCWMSRNLAYDDYRAHTLNNVSRANKANKWNEDNMFTYGNKVGQCWDFANILTVMARHEGIPCTTVENNSHTVNAVWLRGEWVAIDVSVLVSRHCTTEDTDPDNWVSQRDGSYRFDYGYFDPYMTSYNQAIATPETTLSNRSGKNPM